MQLYIGIQHLLWLYLVRYQSYCQFFAPKYSFFSYHTTFYLEMMLEISVSLSPSSEASWLIFV